MEMEMLSAEIANLEPIILNRQAFPQLWKGEYPGPEKLAEMYAVKPEEAAAGRS
jgi:hypothetical protein